MANKKLTHERENCFCKGSCKCANCHCHEIANQKETQSKNDIILEDIEYIYTETIQKQQTNLEK